MHKAFSFSRCCAGRKRRKGQSGRSVSARGAPAFGGPAAAAAGVSPEEGQQGPSPATAAPPAKLPSRLAQQAQQQGTVPPGSGIDAVQPGAAVPPTDSDDDFPPPRRAPRVPRPQQGGESEPRSITGRSLGPAGSARTPLVAPPAAAAAAAAVVEPDRQPQGGAQGRPSWKRHQSAARQMNQVRFPDAHAYAAESSAACIESYGGVFACVVINREMFSSPSACFPLTGRLRRWWLRSPSKPSRTSSRSRSCRRCRGRGRRSSSSGMKRRSSSGRCPCRQSTKSSQHRCHRSLQGTKRSLQQRRSQRSCQGSHRVRAPSPPSRRQCRRTRGSMQSRCGRSHCPWPRGWGGDMWWSRSAAGYE